MANIPGTNVPAVSFGATGFVIPSGPAILAGIEADLSAAWGVALNFALTTPQGQLASSMAAVVNSANQSFQYYTQQVDPAFASGRFQDAIGRIYFMTRIGAQPTTLQVLCSGLGAAIPAGAIVADEANNLYACTTAGTIPGSGSVTLTFACTVPGATPVPSGTLRIYQAISGWDSATVSSGTVGNPTESRPAFEARRQASVASNAQNTVQAIRGVVLAVPGVTSAYVTENPTSSPLTVGGVSLVANSVYVAAVGGSAQAVAQAIWSKKPPGCNYNGNTTETVYDTSQPTPPYPSYSVTFEIPASLPTLFAVSLVASAQVPSNAAQLIQNAIVAAFSAAGTPTFGGIGSLILASNYVAAVAALGSWALIRNILVGSPNVPGASFTGAIAGTALTVSGVTGTIANGQTVQDAAGLVAPGTTIVSGSGTSWVVSISQTVASEAMTSTTPTVGSVQANINQNPTIAPANIAVTSS